MSSTNSTNYSNFNALTPDQIMEIVRQNREAQNAKEKANIVSVANKTDPYTMAGYATGKFLHNMFNKWQDDNYERKVRKTDNYGNGGAASGYAETMNENLFGNNGATDLASAGRAGFKNGLDSFAESNLANNLKDAVSPAEIGKTISDMPSEQLFSNFEGSLADKAMPNMAGDTTSSAGGGIGAGSAMKLAGGLLGSEDLAKAGTAYNKGSGLIRGLSGDPTGWLQFLFG